MLENKIEEEDPSTDSLSEWEQELLDHYIFADKVGDACFCLSVVITAPFILYGVIFNYLSLWETCVIYGPLDFVLWFVMIVCWEYAGTTPDIHDGEEH